jgi:hypothetical protein
MASASRQCRFAAWHVRGCWRRHLEVRLAFQLIGL